MEKHTKKGVKENWSSQAARSRANRSASSAPVGLELKNYEKLLKKALVGRRLPRVLVLGATPELRDLAIKLDVETLAVDVSQDMLDKMTEIMKYKNSPKNLFRLADWLALDKTLAHGSFDAVLADASLNNIAPERYDKMLKILSRLLKSGGHFITRHYVYLPEKLKDSLAQVQAKYNQGRLNWLWITIHLGQYTNWQKEIYNPKTRKFFYSKLMPKLFKAIDSGEIKIKKSDINKLENVKFHASRVIHISLPEKAWQKLVKKYFIIDNRIQVKNLEWTEYGPTWYFKKKI